MARTVIESYFSDIQNGHWWPFCPKFKKRIKICMDLKWREMPSKVNFGGTSNMADQSEMARNAIESDFRTFKMAAEKKQ